MRLLATSILVSVTALAACKSSQHQAGLRDGGDAAADSADLGARLSELASAMTADLNVLFAGVEPPKDVVLALDGAAPVLTEQELDELRARAAAASQAFRQALEASDRRLAQRAETMARLRTRLDAVNAALAQINPSETARYRQGLADISRVVEEMNDAFADSAPIACPAGYIRIKGDRFFGTKDFCVMKYEAKKGADNKPVSTAENASWGPGRWLSAKNACESLGAGYALISNPEWMTIATNAAGTAANWSGGAVGNGRISAGNANSHAAAGPDGNPCVNTASACTPTTWALARRTLVLSDNQVIWDLVGNGSEFVDYSNPSRPSVARVPVSQFPGSQGMETTAVRPTHASHPFWDDAWGTAQGMGSYFAEAASPTAIYVTRGTQEFSTDGALFAMSANWQLTDDFPFPTFRCSFHPQ